MRRILCSHDKIAHDGGKTIDVKSLGNGHFKNRRMCFMCHKLKGQNVTYNRDETRDLNLNLSSLNLWDYLVFQTVESSEVHVSAFILHY
jgi:hypothetical protein